MHEAGLATSGPLPDIVEKAPVLRAGTSDGRTTLVLLLLSLGAGVGGAVIPCAAAISSSGSAASSEANCGMSWL